MRPKPYDPRPVDVTCSVCFEAGNDSEVTESMKATDARNVFVHQLVCKCGAMSSVSLTYRRDGTLSLRINPVT